MDIDSYLNYFNDHEADQNVIYSADMAIIVKKNIGKLYWYKSLVVGVSSVPLRVGFPNAVELKWHLK